MKRDMDEAIDDLTSGGKVMTTVEEAQRLCKLFGVTLYAQLIYVWENAKEAFSLYEIWGVPDKPGYAVNAGELLQSILEQLGVPLDKQPGRGFTGRGFKARANGGLLREMMERRYGADIEPDVELVREPRPDISIDVTEVEI